MFQDPAKVMKLQPMELPADPGLSEVRITITLHTDNSLYDFFNRNLKCFSSGDYPESW